MGVHGSVRSLLGKAAFVTGAEGAYLEEIVSVEGVPHRGRVWATEPAAPRPDLPYAPAERGRWFGRRSLKGFTAAPWHGRKGWGLLLRAGCLVRARLVLVGCRRPSHRDTRVRSAVQALQRSVPPLLHRPEPIRIVLNEAGRVVYVRPSAVPPSLVVRVASRRLQPGVQPLDGGLVFTEKLEDGQGRPGWLVTAEGAQPYRLHPTALLSRAQEEVALSAVSGATVPEIARSLERQPDTIRSHLRAVYRRLGVCSRVELCRLFLEAQPLTALEDDPVSVLAA